MSMKVLVISSSAFLLTLSAGLPRAAGQLAATEADLPVFGIGARQVLRLTVAGARPSDGAERRGCRATLGFRDTRNRPLGPTRGVDLRLGEIAFLDLDARAVGLRGRQRVNARPSVGVAPDSGACEAAFAVLDRASGASVASESSACLLIGLPLVRRGCEFDADSALGPSAIGEGQTLEATMVRAVQPIDADAEPLPCDATLKILADGIPVATLVTGALAPGHAVSVSVDHADLPPPGVETASFSQEILYDSVELDVPGADRPYETTSAAGCSLSYQIIDRATQATESISLPRRRTDDEGSRQPR